MTPTPHPSPTDLGLDRQSIDLHAAHVQTEQPDDDQANDELTSVANMPGRAGLSLDQLHALMGHYARQQMDMQKTRIAQGNRLRAMDTLAAGDMEFVSKASREAIQRLEQAEGVLTRQLTWLAGQHPLGPWIKAQKGVGLPSFARLLALTGPLDRFERPSKLWKFVGLHVTNGHAARREKGQPWTHTNCRGGHFVYCKADCTTEHHKQCQPGVEGTAFSPDARTLCFLMGESIVKAGGDGPWRAAYDSKKAEYLARERRGPSACPFGQTHKDAKGRVFQCGLAHLHQASMRYAVKQLLKEIWHEWQRVVPVVAG